MGYGSIARVGSSIVRNTSPITSVVTGLRRPVTSLTSFKPSRYFKFPTGKVADTSKGAGEVIDGSSRSVMKKMGTFCSKNLAKCSAGVALAGYTAVNMTENSVAQQSCIAECLPPNWPQVVESNGDIEPEYFDEETRLVDGGDGERQPQCTDGTDCEAYCVSSCKAKHPTTVVGAAVEGAGEIMDDIITPVVEKVFGFSMDGIGGGMLIGVRVVALVVGFVALRSVFNGVVGGRRKLRVDVRHATVPKTQ